jgi:hypothetical protein
MCVSSQPPKASVCCAPLALLSGCRCESGLANDGGNSSSHMRSRGCGAGRDAALMLIWQELGAKDAGEDPDSIVLYFRLARRFTEISGRVGVRRHRCWSFVRDALADPCAGPDARFLFLQAPKRESASSRSAVSAASLAIAPVVSADSCGRRAAETIQLRRVIRPAEPSSRRAGCADVLAACLISQ